MDGKRCLWAGVLLAVALAMTGCAGNSAEVEAAKAEYIRAKAHRIEAEVQRMEQEVALLQQQRELARANAELAAELSRRRQEAFIEIGQVVVTGGLGVGSLVALFHALRLLVRTWTEQRLRRLEVESQVLAQRIRWAELEHARLKQERILLEAEARSEVERRKSLQLQIELARAQVQAAREKRWLEQTRKALGIPLEYETADGNGRH